jgi:tetratricopeptide (TPR) repeat protein
MPEVKISPQDWKRLEPLLGQALELERGRRSAWIEALGAQHADLVPLLERMLRTHDVAERARELETVPKLAPPPSAFAQGEAVGPFRLLRPLGRGGMGEVWLAAQVDGRVERQVALKLPTVLGAGDIRAERFRRERDILARLVHPNIARLYDAGASDSGQPWLALEYVEGETLDAHVARTGPSIAARLALFRQVLAAVAHAHRHLVVHRDLKPGNILIDRDGQVKLLDFGIARLLEGGAAGAGGGDLTRIGGRVLTLRYAAPEQVAEGAITTATDVYSLGVVLHELLAGASPYRAVRESRPLTEHAIATEDVALPSSLAPGLAGDLDAILLKALRRDPAQRYPTVEAFDEDIRRFLEQRPVLARAGTWRYLAGRFLRRNRVPIAAVGTVVAALAIGLVLAERERRVAVAERARAQQHFDSVRKLANTFIFDVHGELSELPGALKAREILMKTSLEYLDALAAEAGADPGLQFELAAAYRRIAMVQGQPGASNLGNLAAAVRNLEKGKALMVAVDRVRPDDIAALREHVILSYQLARAYTMQADPRWQGEIASTVELATRVAALPGANMRDRARVGGAMSEQAHLAMFMVGQSPEVEAQAEKAIAVLEALAKEDPAHVTVRGNLVASYQRIAEILTGDRRTREGALRAAQYRRKALDMVRELRRELPNDQRYRSVEIENLAGLTSDHLVSERPREADAAAAQARAAMRSALAAEPDNADIAHTAVYVLALSSTAARRVGDLPRAIGEAREALALDAKRPAESRGSREARNNRAEAQFALGAALLAAARAPGKGTDRVAMLREARPHLADAVTFVAAARSERLGAMADEDVREREQALRDCEEALRRLGAA